MKPHKVQGWLNRKSDDPDEFSVPPAQQPGQSENVCQTYLNAPALAAAESPTHMVSVDEKTGVQALERTAPDLPMQPGHCAKREYEYIRYGTLCLIAALNVVTGKVFPWLNPTRKESGL